MKTLEIVGFEFIQYLQHFILKICRDTNPIPIEMPTKAYKTASNVHSLVFDVDVWIRISLEFDAMKKSLYRNGLLRSHRWYEAIYGDTRHTRARVCVSIEYIESSSARDKIPVKRHTQRAESQLSGSISDRSLLNVFIYYGVSRDWMSHCVN